MEQIILDPATKSMICDATNSYFVFTGNAGMGKCFGRHTPFITASREKIFVQDIAPGTLLLDPKGSPVRVTSVISGKDNLYTISLPRIGYSFLANSEHLLTLQCPKSMKIETFSLMQAPRDWQFFNGIVPGDIDEFAHEKAYFCFGVWYGMQLGLERERKMAVFELEEMLPCIEEVSEFIMRHNVDRGLHVPKRMLEWRLEHRLEWLAGLGAERLEELPRDVVQLLMRTVRHCFDYEVAPAYHGEFYGFEVEGGLVQLFNGVVVHNTTTALCLAHEMKAEVLELNASDDRGYDTLFTKLTNFCKKKSKQRKVIILDECDNITSRAQMYIAQLMERYNGRVTMLLTCNNHFKLHEDILSKVVVIDFNLLEHTGLYEALERICRREKLEHTREGLEAVIAHCNRDIRSCLNILETIGYGLGCINLSNFRKFTTNTEFVQHVEDWLACEDFHAALELLLLMQRKGFNNRDMHQHIRRHIDRAPADQQIKICEALHEILPQMNENDRLDIVLFMQFKVLASLATA